MAIQNTLPDPNYGRRFDGSDSSPATTGPGFASMKLTNDHRMMVTRTNSQKVIARSVAGQKWNIDISYHPMTQAEFTPVYAFLLAKKGPLTSFFVSLPQYRTVQNSAWETVLDTTDNAIRVADAVTAGKSEIIIDSVNPSTIGADSKYPMPGELFTFTDFSDSAHTKAYMVTTVEHADGHQGSAPTANTIRINFSPPLAKNIADNAVVNFKNPLIKVIQPKPMAEYALNTDNLYSFNLKLEEFL